ncbi:hypothetical protein P7C73_g4393, partial [Tremellales sp. Uapishka_1]
MSSRPGLSSRLNVKVTPLPPLSTSQAPNYLDSPGSGSGIRLKIKSSTTPEARGRVIVKPIHRPLPATTVGTGVIVHSDSVGSIESTLLEPFEGDSNETVLVSVRVRPPNATEQRNDSGSAWIAPDDDGQLLKMAKGKEGGRDDREWVFDRILNPDTDNARVYTTSARSHVKSAMEGFNSVIFAYGQTASGKTFTLSGSPSDPGIIPLSITDLFAQIRHTPDREFLLRASYLELYNETILDLLSPDVGRELTLSEGKKKGEVVVNGLTECAVRTEDEVRQLLRVGEERRKVGGTDWNARSSRSHCVFRIVIESRAHRTGGEEQPGRTPAGKKSAEKMTRISTLSIIDLAGSEKHTSSKERNAEGKHINQSLLTLKLVIGKLAEMASKRNVTHVPYRDSKLTRLLQPSLSGDARISVICTISPSPINLAESLSTLSFAQGIKKVALKAIKKEVVDPQALIQQYQNEIAELKALLREKEDGGGERISKVEAQKNLEAEKRLKELKSLILTSGTVRSDLEDGPIEARAVSPTKLKYPKLDFDRSTAAASRLGERARASLMGAEQLQENLHAAEIRSLEQQSEIQYLKAELEMRPLNPDKRIEELQDEISGLKMIAADYERHLLEPSRKVREDVEREWKAKVSRVEAQLESKTIWANRLDENVRHVTAENKALQARCRQAESQLEQIKEWVISALTEPELETEEPGPRGTGTDDFNPSPVHATKTLTLRASKMSQALSSLDLSAFEGRFGSVRPGGKGKMIREESGFDLAVVAEDEFGGF